MRLRVPVATVAGIVASCATVALIAPPAVDSAARPRVVLVTDTTGADNSVWKLAVEGLRRAARELGVEASVVSPSARETAESVATRLAHGGVDLVIGGLVLQTPAFLRAARTSPGTRFVLLDFDPREIRQRLPPNVQAIVFREQEIGFVAGYLAGLVERERPGRDSVATIGGMKYPPVDRFLAGFHAGARRASPGVRTRHAYAGTFVDTAPCARIASAQIAGGAHVVFPAAGFCGNGALAVARSRGVWGVGVDADQSALGPHILTSAVKRFDAAVYFAVERLARGTLPSGGVTSLGLEEGALALGTVSPRVPPRLVAEARRVERLVAAGAIDVPSRFTARRPAAAR